MSKQIRLTPHDVQQPVMCPSLVASEGLELPMRPSCQNAVDVPQGGIESRLIEMVIVVDPATDMVVEHTRQIVERLVAAFVKYPVSDGLPDRLEGFTADCRTERDAEPIPSARQPRPKLVAEKVELVVWEVPASVIVLAIDDFRLVRMQGQPAFRKPSLKQSRNWARDDG